MPPTPLGDSAVLVEWYASYLKVLFKGLIKPC